MPLNPAKQLDIVFNPEKPYTLRLGALKTFRNSPALRRGTEEFQASDHDTVKSKLLDLLFEDCAQLERNFRSMLLEILMISHDDDCVGVRLDAMLKSGIEIKSHSSTKQLFRFTTVILALLDTPMGLTLVRQRLNKILEALTRELYSVLNAIKTESWMHLNLNQSCHNLLQATLCLVTRTRHPIDERTGDNMFSAVLRVCSSPIFDSDFRTVIGIICANIAIGMDLMARFLSVIFDDQCNSQRKLNSVLSEPEMRLMYILGLLNCSLDTIEAARPGSFTALFSIIVEDLKYDHDTRIVGLQCLSKWLNCSIIRKLDFLAVSPEIFKTIFDTIIGNLGYQIDKVQDLLRDIFLAYLRCIATLDAKAEFKSLLLYLQNNLPNDKAAKYDFIAMLLPFIDDAAVDTASNELIETSFKNISNSNITKAIVNSLVAFIRRSSSGAAIDHVANHLSISLVSNDPIIRDLSNRIVLPQLVKSKRDFLDLVASELLRLPSDSISTSHAILNMMQIGRKSGKPLHILGGVTDSLESTLRDCLLSTSNELRFSALAYILEGFKRSTEITESEFEMVKLFLRNHISLDSRHRRKFMLSMNRFLYRIKCLLYSNIREIENLNSKIRYSKIDNQAALYLQIQNEEAKVARKLGFLKWLHKLTVNAFNPDLFDVSRSFIS